MYVIVYCLVIMLFAGWKKLNLGFLQCVTLLKLQVSDDETPSMLMSLNEPKNKDVWSFMNFFLLIKTARFDAFISCGLYPALQLSQRSTLFLCLCSYVMATTFYYCGSPANSPALSPLCPFILFPNAHIYEPTCFLNNLTSDCSTSPYGKKIAFFPAMTCH